MAHKWAQWLHHACLLGDPRCPAKGETEKWPTCGESGYITPAFSGIPNAQHGEKIRNGPQVAQWQQHACLLGDPQCPARGENQK